MLEEGGWREGWGRGGDGRMEGEEQAAHKKAHEKPRFPCSICKWKCQSQVLLDKHIKVSNYSIEGMAWRKVRGRGGDGRVKGR